MVDNGGGLGWLILAGLGLWAWSAHKKQQQAPARRPQAPPGPPMPSVAPAPPPSVAPAPAPARPAPVQERAAAEPAGHPTEAELPEAAEEFVQEGPRARSRRYSAERVGSVFIVWDAETGLGASLEVGSSGEAMALAAAMEADTGQGRGFELPALRYYVHESESDVEPADVSWFVMDRAIDDAVDPVFDHREDAERHVHALNMGHDMQIQPVGPPGPAAPVGGLELDDEAEPAAGSLYDDPAWAKDMDDMSTNLSDVWRSTDWLPIFAVPPDSLDSDTQLGVLRVGFSEGDSIHHPVLYVLNADPIMEEVSLTAWGLPEHADRDPLVELTWTLSSIADRVEDASLPNMVLAVRRSLTKAYPDGRPSGRRGKMTMLVKRSPEAGVQHVMRLLSGAGAKVVRYSSDLPPGAP